MESLIFHPSNLSRLLKYTPFGDESGGAQFSAHIARKVAQYFHTRPKPARDTDRLSSRESEVIELLASGYIYKEIADKLGIGTETVRTHVKNIWIKLHVKNRTEAVAEHFS